ncbi:MAG: hypothetical protein RJA19_461 [Bacteroidota bacterium]
MSGGAEEDFRAQEAAYRADAAGFASRFAQRGGWEAGDVASGIWAERLRADGWMPEGEQGAQEAGGRQLGWLFPLLAGTSLFLALMLWQHLEGEGGVGDPERYVFTLVPAVLGILLVAQGWLGGWGRVGWRVIVPVLLVAGAVVGWAHGLAWTEDLVSSLAGASQAVEADFDRINGLRQVRGLMGLHLPLGMLGVLGWVYVRNHPRTGRVEFVRHVIQVAIYTGLLLGGGGVLMGMMLLLMDLLEWTGGGEAVLQPLVWWGVLSAPFFAHHIWMRYPQALERVLSVMARIFVPLFLLLEAGTLLVFLSRGVDALAADREQLLVFNLLLLVVVGLVLLQAAWGEEMRRGMWGMLGGLVALGVLADGFALVAIGQRLWEGGWTPNRFAVLGGNAVLLVTLAGVLMDWIRPRGQERLRGALGWALAVYVGWAFVVACVLPGVVQWRARGIDGEPFLLVPASEVVADPDAEGPAR